MKVGNLVLSVGKGTEAAAVAFRLMCTVDKVIGKCIVSVRESVILVVRIVSDICYTDEEAYELSTVQKVELSIENAPVRWKIPSFSNSQR